VEQRPIEVQTDHPCLLGLLTRRLANARADDTAALAADALEALLRDGTFDRCCLPRYVSLAPKRGDREVQIPIASRGGIETRVLVWPPGAGDGTHPHSDGWTVFAPAAGHLVAVDTAPGDGTAIGPVRARKAALLRPEDAVRHRLRNAEDEVAVTIHVSGPRA
jgi:Cysteine dioxygenase type I